MFEHFGQLVERETISWTWRLRSIRALAYYERGGVGIMSAHDFKSEPTHRGGYCLPADADARRAGDR